MTIKWRFAVVSACALLVALGVGSSRAAAQGETGRIEGIVTDPSGAGVPGATVDVTNLDRNIVQSAVTDEAGRYTIASVRAGRYKIAVTLQGFAPATTAEVVLSVGQVLRQDYQLKVGGVAEAVSVVAESPLVDRVTSSIGTVIDEQQVKELPLNGRNFTQLATLTPGVNRGIPGSNADGSAGNAETFRYGDSGSAALSVNGVREQFNNFMLDGVDNNESLVNSTSIFPPVEGIKEFRVLTSGAPAEFGRAGGAVINVITKGGTNRFTGSGYEFFRDDALDAKPHFATDKLDFRRNQFGGSLGGPIVAGKTFFFGEYSALRETLPVEAGGRVTVPTAKMRQGDFSELLNPAFTGLNQPITIYSPTTGQPYPNNIISSGDINPVGRAYLNAFPLPDITSSYQQNYFTHRQRKSDFDNYTARIDHVFSPQSNLFARFSGPFGEENRFDPGRIPGYQAGFGSGEATNMSFGNVGGWNRVFSGGKVNELRVGYNSQEYGFLPVGFGENQNAALGIPGPGGITNNNGISLIGGGNGQWIEYLGDFGQYVVPQRTFHLSDAVTWMRGPHTMKFGGAIIRRKLKFDRTQIGKGFYFFSDFNATPGNVPPLGQTGFEVSDMLAGRTSFTATGVPGSAPRTTISWENSLFAQDDWQVNERLTLNLGLRYDVFSPYYEKDDRLANYDPSTNQIILAGQNGVPRSTVDTDWNNFGPRAGFAYQLNPKTVVRGAYGIFYSVDRGGIDNQLTENPPYVVTQYRFSGPGANVRLSDPIPVPAPVDPNNPVLPDGSAVVYVPSDTKTTQIQQYNVSVQREVWKSAAMMVAYVGTHGDNLTAITTRAGFSGALVDRLTTVANIATSNYNALQLQLRQSLSHGFTYLASYTLSKATNDSPGPYPGPGSNFQNTPTDPRNLGLDEGLADYDRTHYFSLALTYQIPWMRDAQGARGALLGGWQANGIITLASGTPFSVFDNTGRAQLVGDPEGPGTVEEWFNTSAFVANADPASQHERNILRAPGISTVDASLFKTFHTVGTQAFEFRIEAFNLFNKNQYGLPGIFVGNVDFGEIRSTRLNSERQIQLAFRYTF